MSFSNKILQYSNIRIEISCFETAEGVVEYHAVLHIINTQEPFDKQLLDMQSAYFYLLSSLGHSVKPVFKRYFLSDAANQTDVLLSREKSYPPCATSIVQQPPMDGSKIALWVYLISDIEAVVTRDGVKVDHNGYSHLWNARQHSSDGDSHTQTQTLLMEYLDDLEQQECTLKDNCIRTWFFVQNVDVNYRGVVEARKELFLEHGLTPSTHFITSTGIEGRHADPDVLVLLDAYSVKGLQAGQQQFLYAPTHLNPTYEYGVTFERGVRVLYGDRSHIFISGTASIDNRGEIVAPGDIVTQTERMLENIEVLLKEADAGMGDIAQMIVYLRDTADFKIVDTIIRERLGHIPGVITLAPVCRPGWLIEAECIAITEQGNPSFNPL